MTTSKPLAVTLRLVPCWRRGRARGMAGVEDARSATQVRHPLSAGFAGPAPLPLPSSTPAMPLSLWGGGVAVSLSIVESLTAPRPLFMWRKGRPASSLDLQQMRTTGQVKSSTRHARNQKAGPRGVERVPAGLSRAVNRRAPVRRFASALRVTARRPAGGPLSAAVRRRGLSSLLGQEKAAVVPVLLVVVEGAGGSSTVRFVNGRPVTPFQPSFDTDPLHLSVVNSREPSCTLSSL